MTHYVPSIILPHPLTIFLDINNYYICQNIFSLNSCSLLNIQINYKCNIIPASLNRF